ncbi:cyclic nucleotide-binding/CBS domain-containing protein [Candidatus Nitrosotenuis cloacae]|jgi:CBS domain-containing protein|uniref:CBS domain-containing protein n=1 Tax=Candidatus Nitrosotenuis cloacae TaxID=1603555 RepID=UPI00227EA373|nr:CBS domain-containing protein [Candidatus Nitrosotenuis cloacae]
MAQAPQEILVRDIMTRSLITVDASATVNEAAKLMEKAKVGSVIVTENDIPIGIMTDRDFAIRIAAHAYPIHTKVKQVMSSPLIHINSSEGVWVAADLMYTRKIRRLPVLDEDVLRGIVTATDFVRLLTVCNSEDTRKMYYHALTRMFDDHVEDEVVRF